MKSLQKLAILSFLALDDLKVMLSEIPQKVAKHKNPFSKSTWNASIH